MTRKLATLMIAGLLILPACKKQEEKTDEQEPAAEKQQADEQEQKELTPAQAAREKAKSFKPLPEVFESDKNPVTTAKTDLGRMLYYDTRLSMSGEISCNTCHPLENYGVEQEAVSTGHDEQKGERNAPTVYNAANQIAQFWDGRAASVEEQATGPVLNPIEMGMPDPDYVVEVVNSIPGYKERFAKAFPDQKDPVTIDNIGRAIGAFERKLVTPSRWDKFLEGDDEALTKAELEGFAKFVETGCDSCHFGSQVGGQLYQKLGLVQEWPDTSDLGRYKVTEEEADKMKFKVPVLRNIAETAPYYHDGSVEKLDDAVKLMAKHQRGVELSDEDTKSIVTFLEALTGPLPKEYIAKPELPESGPKTPQAAK